MYPDAAGKKRKLESKCQISYEGGGGRTAAEVLSSAKDVTGGGALRSTVSASLTVRAASTLTINHGTEVATLNKIRENHLKEHAFSKHTRDRSILHLCNSSGQASNKSFLRSLYRRSGSIRWNNSSSRYCSILFTMRIIKGQSRIRVE